MKSSDFDCAVAVIAIDEAVGRLMEVPKLQIVKVGRMDAQFLAETWQVVKQAMTSDRSWREAWHQAVIDVVCVADLRLYCSRYLHSESALNALALHWIEPVWVQWILSRTHYTLARSPDVASRIGGL